MCACCCPSVRLLKEPHCAPGHAADEALNPAKWRSSPFPKPQMWRFHMTVLSTWLMWLVWRQLQLVESIVVVSRARKLARLRARGKRFYKGDRFVGRLIVIILTVGE